MSRMLNKKLVSFKVQYRQINAEKWVAPLALLFCAALSSCSSGKEDSPVLRNAPDKSFLGFHLNKPINLPPCLSKTDEVEKTCIQGEFIYLQPDEIPNFMEGNDIFISTIKDASLAAGPQHFSIMTKFDEHEAVLANLRGKYGAEDERYRSENRTDETAPVWYWTFADLEVQHLNFNDDENHIIAVFTKDYARQRAAQIMQDSQERMEKEEKKRSL